MGIACRQYSRTNKNGGQTQDCNQQAVIVVFGSGECLHSVYLSTNNFPGVLVYPSVHSPRSPPSFTPLVPMLCVGTER